jgi:hypothetical protein
MTQSDACAARIRREHAQLEAAISAALPAPPGHAWRTDRLHFTWCQGDALASTCYGCHLHLGPAERPSDDPDQIRIEVRWFWRACADTPARYRSLRETDCERAIVWCEAGPNIVGRHRSLLTGSACHLRGDGIADLAARVIACLRPGLARWEAERAAQAAPLARVA